MRLLRVGLILGLAPFLTGAKELLPQPLPVNPAWRTDLRSAIGTAPVGVVWGGVQEYKGRPKTSLWFADDNTIVATFVIRDGNGKPQVSRRGGPDDTLALRLQAIFLDASSGKLTTTSAWPTESRRSSIIAVHDGELVMLGGSDLILYAPDLTVSKRLKLPPGGLVGWLARPSPTGKNILFHTESFSKGPWIWVETDTLKILSWWEDNPSGYLSISDDTMATSTCWWGHELISTMVTPSEASARMQAGPKCKSEVEIRGLSGDWKTIASGEPHQYPQFVNDDLLFVPGKDVGKLIGVDGSVILEEPKGRRSWGCWATEGVLPAARGHRFVIPSCEWKGAVASLDIGAHPVLKQIFVYDIGFRIQTQVIQVKGPKVRDEMQFAVSPDGSKLAILNHEFVEVLRLPPPK